jgi:hypothetical protein
MLPTTCNLILMALRGQGSCTIDQFYRLTRRGKTILREELKHLDLGEEIRVVDGIRTVSYFLKPYGDAGASNE